MSLTDESGLLPSPNTLLVSADVKHRWRRATWEGRGRVSAHATGRSQFTLAVFTFLIPVYAALSAVYITLKSIFITFLSAQQVERLQTAELPPNKAEGLLTARARQRRIRTPLVSFSLPELITSRGCVFGGAEAANP